METWCSEIFAQWMYEYIGWFLFTRWLSDISWHFVISGVTLGGFAWPIDCRLYHSYCYWQTCILKSFRYFDTFRIVWPYIVTDSLWIKPTDPLNSSFIGITTLHFSGSLTAHHQEFLAIHVLWYILSSCDELLLPRVGWNSAFLPIIRSS